MKKLDIISVKTKDDVYFISLREEFSWNSSRKVGFTYLLFDGKKAKKSFHKDWYVLNNIPKKITLLVSQPNINHRYVIQDESLISDKLPREIKREDVAFYDKTDYCWVWKDEMNQYRSLYKEVSDEQPDKEEEIEFNFEVIMSVDTVLPPANISYEVNRIQWISDGTINLTSNDIINSLIDKIFFPEILLPQRPCKLSSYNSYKIVRNYIKNNIDSSVASITSDYDFCFTVKRKIPLAKIETYTVDLNNSIFSKRKRKPKYVTKQKAYKEEQCFEMTYSPYNYHGYTPIKEFFGNNQEELKNNIDTYCKEIIDFINKPLKECKYCDGTGYIISTNKK